MEESSASMSPTLAVVRSQVSSIDVPAVKTGICATSSNLVNAIVGAGIIGIPFAIKETGFVIGILLLIIVGVFTDKSLRLIVNMAAFHPQLKHLGVLTYEDLMAIPFGTRGRYFVLISMMIFAYGAMVAYLLIVKDCVPDLLGLGDTFAEREVVMLVTSAFIMLPLSMLRDISQLACTSSLSVIADIVLLAILCVVSPVSSSVSTAGGLGAVITDNWISSGVFIGLGVLSTAMACQHSSFLIFNTLDNRTSRRWAMVTGLSLFLATVMTLTFGVVGYLGYLSDTQGDVLINFGDDTIAHAARALLAVTMFLTYPMESFVARHVVAQLLFGGNLDNTTIGSNGEVVEEHKWMRCLGRRERWTLYLYMAALVPALIFRDLGPVLSLTGSLGASAVAYIAPGLVYLGVNGDAFMAWMMNGTTTTTTTTEVRGNEDGDMELPVAGDAKATINVPTIGQAQEASSNGRTSSLRSKWWWWPLGIPLWMSVARSGAMGTRTFLTNQNHSIGDRICGGDSHDEDSNLNGEVSLPQKSDFVYSIVLLVFGVVAAVAGVASNVYVQVNNIFFTPT